jgi:protein TonB
MVLSERPKQFTGMNRNVIIASSVVLFHVAALWVLQTGLLRRAVELVVPAEVLVEFMEPPAAKLVPRAPAPPKPAPVKQAVAPAPVPVRSVAPPVVAPPAAAPVAAAPPAPARVELPSSDADYLQNPKPPYPVLSKRLGEQGKVVVRVLIGVDGTAQKAEIKQSSGFERLDQAALGTVLRWRYVPGKRAGVPETMWFNVPINFVLE